MIGFKAMRVLDVEVIAASLDLIDSDLPSLRPFLASGTSCAAPPVNATLEVSIVIHHQPINKLKVT